MAVKAFALDSVGTAFHRPEWLAACSACLIPSEPGAYVLVCGDEPIAYMPGVRVPGRRGLVRRFLSNPWATYGGIVSRGTLRPELGECFRAAMCADRVGHTVFTLHPDANLRLHRALVTAGCRPQLVYTHVLRLPQCDVEPRSLYSKSCRNRVRKGLREGIEAERVTDPASVEVAHALHAQRLQLKRAEPLPLEMWQELVAQKGFCRLYGAWCDGQLVASLLTVWGEREAMAWAAGSSDLGRRINAMNVLIDRLISDACAEGKDAVDLGASEGDRELERFKAGFGARPRIAFNLKQSCWLGRLPGLSIAG